MTNNQFSFLTEAYRISLSKGEIMHLAENIKQLRIRNALTQSEIAEQLHVSAPAVNKRERGVSKPDIELLEPLAKILKCSIDFLLTNNPERISVTYDLSFPHHESEPSQEEFESMMMALSCFDLSFTELIDWIDENGIYEACCCRYKLNW